MSNDLLRVLKLSSSQLLIQWLHGFDLNVGAVPHDTKERKNWARSLLADLKREAGDALAGLVYDAKRIALLSEARFDWVFSRLRPYYGDVEAKDLGGFDRALACRVNDYETFEIIERRITHENLSHQKRRHTKFQSEKGLDPEPTSQQVERMEHEVQELYRDHDGSGTHAATELDKSTTPAGDTLHLVTVYLSQLPAPQDEFSHDGDLDSRSVRKVTEVQASYEPKTGFVFVTTSRGGFPIRERVASIFARVVLDVQEDPAVILKERFELSGALDPKALPPLEGLPFDEINLVETELMHPAFGTGTVLSLRGSDGIDPNAIEGLTGGHPDMPRVLSATFCIQLSAPGFDKPKFIRVRLNEDGSTSLKGDVPHEQVIRDNLPKAWHLLRQADD
ncbi:MAG: hypothetical protein HRT80_16255 [Henriciella sp.]|nr:hypothetical protein [Henriciella sp.]